MGRTRRHRATPFCVSNLQRRHTYHKKEEREKEIRLAAREREKEMAGTDGAGGAWG